MTKSELKSTRWRSATIYRTVNRARNHYILFIFICKEVCRERCVMWPRQSMRRVYPFTYRWPEAFQLSGGDWRSLSAHTHTHEQHLHTHNSLCLSKENKVGLYVSGHTEDGLTHLQPCCPGYRPACPPLGTTLLSQTRERGGASGAVCPRPLNPMGGSANCHQKLWHYGD